MVLEDIFLQPMTKKKVLVFINDSLGELDWIQPFLSSYSSKYNFFVYLYLAKKSKDEKREIFKSYFGNNCQIVHLDDEIYFPAVFPWLDLIMDSILRRTSSIYSPLFNSLRKIVDIFRLLIGMLLVNFIKFPEFDLIFRDYNLKDSFFLSTAQSKNKKAKVCVFPHSTAIESNTERTPKSMPKKIKADLFFENTELSNQFSEAYRDIFVAVGSPSIELASKSEKQIANYSSKSFLFITRNCDPSFFGINYEDSGQVFLEALIWAKNNGYKVYVKHHPRDNKLSYWRSLQSRFSNIEEVEYTLNNFNKEIAFALCFYTSVGLLLSVRSVPVFDISPYKGDPKNLPFHFENNDFKITHELVEYGMYDQFENFNDFTKSLSHDFLRLSAMKHKENLEKYFPKDTNSMIHKSIQSFFN